jgi:hypothetical protein
MAGGKSGKSVVSDQVKQDLNNHITMWSKLFKSLVAEQIQTTAVTLWSPLKK